MQKTQSRLFIPGLRPFYDWAEPVSWALVRITAGPLMWGLIMMAIALRGGGPYSLDRWLGREL